MESPSRSPKASLVGSSPLEKIFTSVHPTVDRFWKSTAHISPGASALAMAGRSDAQCVCGAVSRSPGRKLGKPDQVTSQPFTDVEYSHHLSDGCSSPAWAISFTQPTPTTQPFPALLWRGVSSTAGCVSPAVSASSRLHFQVAKLVMPTVIRWLCHVELSQHGTTIINLGEDPVSVLIFASYLCRRMSSSSFRYDVHSQPASQPRLAARRFA